MAGELKREQSAAEDSAGRARVARSQPDVATGRPDSSWFDALDPAQKAERGRGGVFAAPLFVAALVAVAVVRSVLLRVLLPVALAAAAVLLLLRGKKPAPRKPSRARRGLLLGPDRLAFEATGAVHVLLFTDAPFGVTLLANQRRERLIALLTSSAGTFSIGASIEGARGPAFGRRAGSDDASRQRLAPLFAAASTVFADELGLEAIGPDGEPLLLSAEHFAAVVDALARRNPSCLSRFVLSDPRGSPVTLDGSELTVGDRVVDLASPLEWRPLLFREAIGQTLAIDYQGTWVRQGAHEFVLVSLLPSFGASRLAEADLAGLDRGALRDLRLMQAAPEPPPPSEQRVAIERLFMLPLRAALDRAPRATHRPSRAQA